MRSVIFRFQRGWGDEITEEFEYEEETTDDEIEEDFKDWIWEFIGDNCSWDDKE
ncbi:hypothetical protein [Paraliobacillus ryukyuensis]|uniref:hypothetical protein n=1 Tax=Paraliobacillus ryukyuensis TaxID=200904 RepID=UPI0015C499A3|nr:hypothetical protein [Paraliobacillus ryukyuensis]